MKLSKYLTFFIVLLIASLSNAQDQKILVFDPNGVSTSFQFTLSQLTEDAVFIADTLDDSIYNYNAAFIFINYPYILSQTNAGRLISFTSAGNPLYVFSQLWFDSTSIAFWNHIGITDAGWLLISGIVDSVTGIDTTFTNGIFIDTSWYSGIPVIYGDVQPILTAWYHFPTSEFYSTYISGDDSLNVILDLFNLIDDYGFLEKVLEHFSLISPNDVEDKFNSVSGLELFQNYPNPFNPRTKIKFEIPDQVRNDRSLVTLKVYDILGSEIATLVKEEKPAGTYEVEFSAVGTSRDLSLPSGIYFYQLKVIGPESSSGQVFIETKKMVLIK